MPESESRVSPVPARLVAGRYLLVRELGRGGMGVVWLAEDQLVGRQVAVKELRAPPGLPGEDLATFRQRALQEASSAARIHHRHAVTLYDVLPATADDDAVYLIMEFIDGPTLAQVTRRDGPLPADRVADYGLQLLDVLEAAHALGITHRDVKPANIMITADGTVKLTDFGIAHITGNARLTRSGVIGTQAYMAPERFDADPITHAADLWSLGATLYAAAEGREPFGRDATAATMRAILVDDIPIPACQPTLAAAITSLLQRDPSQRATISEARSALRQAVSGPATRRPPPVRRPADGPSAHRARSGNDATTGHRQPDGPPTWERANTTKRPLSREVRTSRETTTATTPHKPSPLRRVVNGALSTVILAAFLGGLYLINKPSGPSGPALPKEVRAVLRQYLTGGTIGSVAFTSDGGRVVAGSDAPAAIGQAWVWDAATGKQVASLPSGATDSLAAISPDGSTLGYGTANHQVELWSTASRSVTRAMRVPGPGTPPYTVAFSPDGHTLAAGGDNGPQVYLYDLTSDSLSATLTGPEPALSLPAVTLVVFSPDGSLLAAANGHTGQIFVWNVAARRLIGTVTVPQGCDFFCDAPGWITFSPDSGTLAVADQRQGVRLWNVATQTWGATIPVGNVQSVIAFSPDGSTLATGTFSGAITLWSLASDRPISTLRERGDAEVTAIAFSPDGKTLATGDTYGGTYLWNVPGS